MASNAAVNMLVVAAPSCPELSVLSKLPPSVKVHGMVPWIAEVLSAWCVTAEDTAALPHCMGSSGPRNDGKGRNLFSATPFQVLRVGQTAEDFADLSDEQCASVSVLLNCGVGANAGKAKDIQVRLFF